MRIRFLGGPAAHAGPRFFRALGVALTLAFAFLSKPVAAFDWIPPRPVTAYLPNVTLAPASTHVLQLVVLASGAPANVFWNASFSGAFPANVAPTAGFLSIPAGGSQTVDLTVTLPDTADGSGFLSVELTHQAGGGRAAKAVGGIYAATLGKPEVMPVPGSWRATAGTSGAMSYQVHSLAGVAEIVDIGVSRSNPDANNFGAIFAGSFTDTLKNLPAGGTITVTVPTTLAANAYAGNLNSIQLNVSSAAGTSVGDGQAIVSAPQPGSLPTALVPVGLVPFDAMVAGRDGSASLPARAYRLIPSGLNGVRVMREVSIDSIGMVDTNGDGVDDRLLGTIRIPAFAAALAVIPGFVSAAGDTLDLGLLAAGRAGLLLLDHRVLEDPSFGTWEDFFDVDGNGIDDRILRTIPLSGFATDVAWIRAPSGRPVALVADADSGSVPVSPAYNPALTVAGTGQGVIAIDVAADRRRPTWSSRTARRASPSTDSPSRAAPRPQSPSRRAGRSRSPRRGGRRTRAISPGSRTRRKARTSPSRRPRGACRSFVCRPRSERPRASCSHSRRWLPRSESRGHGPAPSAWRRERAASR